MPRKPKKKLSSQRENILLYTVSSELNLGISETKIITGCSLMIQTNYQARFMQNGIQDAFMCYELTGK